MDLLEQPDVKKTYEKCKYIVKLWEHNFTKTHKRLPSKLDIREASSEVRHAYRKYYQLKTAALEQSFMDIEGFDEWEENDEKSTENQSEPKPNQILEETNVNIPKETWGPHLNIIKPINTDDTEKTENKPNLNLNITKKLFCGSKFNKRNPRKSLSFTQKQKSEQNTDSPKMVLSQPETLYGAFKSEEAIAETHNDNIFNTQSVKIVTSSTQIASQPINFVQSIVDNNYSRTLKKVDKGWLKRMADETGVEIQQKTTASALNTKFDYDSDSEDIIDDSDDEQPQNNTFHVVKKFRCDFTSSQSGNNQNINEIQIKNEEITNTNEETKIQDVNTRKSSENAFKNAENNRKIKENRVDKNIEGQFSEETSKIDEEIEEKRAETMKTAQFNEETSNTAEEIHQNQSKKKKQKKAQLTTSKNARIDEETSSKLKKHAKSRQEFSKIVENIKESSSDKLKEENRSKIFNEEIEENASKTKKADPSAKEENDDLISPRRSTRQNRPKASFQELSSGEEDPFHSDNDEHDPEYTIEEKKTKFGVEETDSPSKQIKTKLEKNTKTPKAKKSRRKEREETETKEDNDETAPYEMEFSVKPRIVAPRYTDIKKIIKENRKEQKNEEEEEQPTSSEAPKDKRQQAREKLEQRIAAGNLNENFVRINLKKKVFVRGKKGINFSKFKKNQWKSKKKALCGPDMDMGGCDGGALTCFNCGKTGHFARQCKETKGDGLLPLTAAQEEEEECPFPTLEEASQMAKESALTIRKPQISHQIQEEGNGNNDDDEDEEEESDWEDGIDSEELLAETLRLEEHIRKLDVKNYMDTVKTVQPFYPDDLSASPPEVIEALKMFGHDSFRAGQEKAVLRILQGKSTLVTLSTGSGKSLCYQLPAFLYSRREPCISLVISPLVSLMEDQVTGIPKFLKAACLHTNQTKVQRQKIMEALSNGELNVLLISPEAVVAGEKQTGFGSLLRRLPPIAFACIDEAHCVSQWSHNFRPSYLMICRVLRESLGVKTVLGLTATATRATCDSIVKHLDIPDGNEGIITDIPLPDNLILTVSKDTQRDRALLNLLLSERFADCRSIIVYCTRRDECERIASFLRTSLKTEQVPQVTNKKRKRVNLQAEPYHAGLSASRRKTIQNAFMSGELRIVVATVAFGMGINKADIRSVIHFNMPNSFESYVQEVGRAGRDGLKAHCHLFLDSQNRDECELRRHIHANSIDRHVIRKLLKRIFVPCSCKTNCPKHEVAFSIEETVRALDIPEENISTLLCYLELHKNKYIELLNPGYTMCKVISYGGPLQIRKAAKDCPPLAMALALHNKGNDENVIEFPVVDVAAAMGWESGICKHKLKNLEWATVNNQPKRSTLTVTFSNLGFRLLAPGNLSDDQLDEALDSLHSRVVNQEGKALKQLRVVHKTLVEVAKPSYKQCIAEENSDNQLKSKVRRYFESPDPLKDVEDVEAKITNEDQLVNDIRALVCMYRDNQFTGRAVARIFHGIQSPNYPAVIWGRCKFWRIHLADDFHEICRIATREIIRMR